MDGVVEYAGDAGAVDGPGTGLSGGFGVVDLERERPRGGLPDNRE